MDKALSEVMNEIMRGQQEVFKVNPQFKAMMGDFRKEIKKTEIKYNAVIKEVNTKLEILNEEYHNLHQHNPIEHIKSRVKSIESITEKIQRKSLPLTPESMNQLHDIAGIRVVCSFVSDIYIIAEALKKQNDITVIEEKDYVKHPKANGYQSLHLILSVPIFFSDHSENVDIEIQIRTIAMDFWASLEHQLRYKYDGNMPEDISLQLSLCAKNVYELDQNMLSAYNRLKG